MKQLWKTSLLSLASVTNLATSLGFSSLFISLPAIAIECRSQEVQPASTTREIVNDEHRLRFEIPTNYRSLLEHSEYGTRIVVRNPADFEFEICLEQPGNSRNRRYVSTDVDVLISDLPSTIRSSSDLVNYANSLEDRFTENTSIERIRIGGQDGIVVVQAFSGNVSRYATTRRHAYLIHPDGRHLIQIQSWKFGGGDIEDVDVEVQNLIMSTLSFF